MMSGSDRNDTSLKGLAHSKASVSAGHSCHYHMPSTLTCAGFSYIITAFSLRGGVMILLAEDFFTWWCIDMSSAL